MSERDQVASIIRDWIHETPLSQCDMGSDTCPDWDLAYELTDRIIVEMLVVPTDRRPNG